MRQATVRSIRSICMSVRPYVGNISAPTGQIFVKTDISLFRVNMSRKFRFLYNLTKTTDTLQKDLQTFIITSRSILLRIKNILDKRCRENQNTNSVLLYSKYSDFCEILCTNIVEPEPKGINIIRRMCLYAA